MEEDEAIFYVDYAVSQVIKREFDYQNLDEAEETIITLCANTVMSHAFDICECSYDRESYTNVKKSCLLLRKLPEALKTLKIGE
jgi:hypothetical protein